MTTRFASEFLLPWRGVRSTLERTARPAAPGAHLRRTLYTSSGLPSRHYLHARAFGAEIYPLSGVLHRGARKAASPTRRATCWRDGSARRGTFRGRNGLRAFSTLGTRCDASVHGSRPASWGISMAAASGW